MVTYTENSGDGGREFEGTISKIEQLPAEGKYPAQYKLTITPNNKPEWKEQTMFISIPGTSTDKEVPKKSYLGVLCKTLENLGLKGETHKELIDSTFNQKFKFKDITPKVDGENITKKDKLVWVQKIDE